MLALVGFDDGTDDPEPGPSTELHGVAEDTMTLFDDIESALENEIAERSANPTLPHPFTDAFAQCRFPSIRHQDTSTDRQSYNRHLPVHAFQSRIHIQVKPSV